MEESRATEYLVHFGLSRQEALVYEQLLAGGKQTGYEIARDTGISRSNAYTSLAALVEKGAAYLVEESAKKYIPVCPEEFCGNRIRRMQEEQRWLVENLSRPAPEEEGYITVDREENIKDRIYNLLDQAEFIFLVPQSVWSSLGENCPLWQRAEKRLFLSQTGHL